MITRLVGRASLSLALTSLVFGVGWAAPLRTIVLPQREVGAQAKIKTISTDPFTNTTSQHKTEVEPDIFAFGSVEVAAFQQGRFFDGGSSDIGWATSANGGAVWHHGSLPGITKIQSSKNIYDRVSDPAVAFDSKHGLWLVSTLPIVNVSGPIGQVPLVSSSADGLHWGNPVAVATNNGDYMDKDWITCDNWAKSPNLGHCYVEFDDVFQGDAVMMTTSADGGKTWSTPFSVGVFGLGGQPLALPNGVVVVPYADGGGTISSFMSKDGGKTWGNPTVIATVNTHFVNGNMRTQALPSAAIDGSGRVYVTWQDCSFRSNCNENDIVMSTSTNGTTWSAISRIPIDPVNSSVDHFIPGFAADIATGGTSAHLGLTYYFFPQTNCSVSSCQLFAGYVGSTDSGASWSAPITLTPAMKVSWLANTNQGFMVGDYIGTAFSGGLAHAPFAVAKAPRGSTFDEFMATSAKGLPAFASTLRYTSRGERPVAHPRSDRIRRYTTTI